MSISLSGVGHTYGKTRVLEGLNLALEPGELLCVLGPSGSGKSTLLKLLSGLEALQEGQIELGDMTVTPIHCPPPEKRPIGLVFQEHALFPHMTVEQNLAFGLSHLSTQERDQIVAELLQKIELEPFRSRLPSMLSGGQQQRVALARALAPQPDVLLLDEPFASVDVLLKTRLRQEMRDILKALGSTSVLVTHDPEDALMLADRIAVLVAGQLVQLGTPQTLWQQPEHPFVAEVFARKQLLDGNLASGVVETAFGDFQLAEDLGGANPELTKRVVLAVDPRQIVLSAQQESPVKVVDIRFAGDCYQTVVANGEKNLICVCDHPPSLEIGQSVALSIASHGIRAYNRE